MAALPDQETIIDIAATAVPDGHELSARLKAGDVLAERYEVRRFVAAGAMGEVFEVYDRSLQLVVALKVLSTEGVATDAIQRFKREVALARMVTHPNVCRVHDLVEGQLDDGTPILALTMELLVGVPLDKYLREHGPLPFEQCMTWLTELAAAVDAAHAAGIIHRDLKPANIILVAQVGGRLRAVITDFGIARQIDGLSPITGVRNALVGSPAYMSPEQFAGRQVGPATDLYALGATAFEMLTGRVPFQAYSVVELAQRVRDETPPPCAELRPGVPSRWEAAIARSLAKSPQARFRRAADLIDAMQGRRSRPRAPWFAAVLLLGSTAAGLLWLSRPPQVAATDPRAHALKMLRQHRMDLAYHELETLALADNSDCEVDLNLLIASLWHKRDQFSKHLTVARACEQPKSRRMFIEGLAEFERENYAAALSRFRSGLALDPADPYLLYGAMDNAFHQHDFSSVVEFGQKLQAVAPDWRPAVSHLMDYWTAVGATSKVRSYVADGASTQPHELGQVSLLAADGRIDEAWSLIDGWLSAPKARKTEHFLIPQWVQVGILSGHRQEVVAWLDGPHDELERVGTTPMYGYVLAVIDDDARRLEQSRAAFDAMLQGITDSSEWHWTLSEAVLLESFVAPSERAVTLGRMLKSRNDEPRASRRFAQSAMATLDPASWPMVAGIDETDTMFLAWQRALQAELEGDFTVAAEAWLELAELDERRRAFALLRAARAFERAGSPEDAVQACRSAARGYSRAWLFVVSTIGCLELRQRLSTDPADKAAALAQFQRIKQGVR